MSHRVIASFFGLVVFLAIVASGVHWQWPEVMPSPAPPPAEANNDGLGDLLDKFKVTWNPSSVSATIGQGQESILPVSFTSPRPLRNVVVRVDPELQPFVRVVPQTIDRIEKGQTIRLDVILAAPADAVPGTARGLIRLFRVEKLKGKNFSFPVLLARSLPVAVEVWNGYVDPAGAYSVAFPSNLVAEAIDNALVLAAEPGTGEEMPLLRLATDANPTGLSFQDYYDGEPGRDLVGQCEGVFSELTVGGVVALRCIPVISFSGETVMVVPRPGGFLRIDDVGGSFEASGLLEAILGTVEF